MVRRNLEMYAGDTFPFEVTVENNGSGMNITNYSFRMTAKYDIKDADVDAVFSITSPGNITITDAANGDILVTVPASATSDLEIGFTYYLQYDIQMYSDPGTIYTVCSGILKVNPTVSRTAP